MHGALACVLVCCSFCTLCRGKGAQGGSVPINLQEVELVLVRCFSAARARGAENLASGKKLVGEAAKTRPTVDLATVHVNKECTARGGEDGVAVVGLVLVVDDGASWMNARVAHDLLLCMAC